MYIQFRLPTGAGGLAAGTTANNLKRHLETWSDRYGIPMRTKAVKYTLRVTFNDDAHYQFFALTWNPPRDHAFSSFLTNYVFIDPGRQG